MIQDELILGILVALLGGIAFTKWWHGLTVFESALAVLFISALTAICLPLMWYFFSRSAQEKRKRIEKVSEIPLSLCRKSSSAIKMGIECDLGLPIYLPDSIRFRHVHILGATGSGKTESVILNFLKQDVARGLGSIILDAKGDTTFLSALNEWVPNDRLRMFDLSSKESLSYDPLAAGFPMEAAQRLFSSLTWSEDYYKSKALSALQRIFQQHAKNFRHNPTLADISDYLESPKSYAAITESNGYPIKLAEKDFMDLAGLRDQIRTLCIGHLKQILSPEQSGMALESATSGSVLYFRLQSLLSPQIVTTVGKLLINHLNYIAGTAHREKNSVNAVTLIPTYFDEFAAFACPEFADLISKARSAGLALHFSHQSIGDLADLPAGFLNRITDNSATKIVLRINDPDSADFLARSFGTQLYQKVTQRITKVTETNTGEIVGEGTQREAHQFRAAPDLFKTLPTGVGSVLIAHGIKTPHGASTVFKIKFPKLSTN